MQQPETEPPYTVARLAEAADIPRRTILNRIAAGQIVATKLGESTSAWIIPADEARRYLESIGRAA